MTGLGVLVFDTFQGLEVFLWVGNDLGGFFDGMFVEHGSRVDGVIAASISASMATDTIIKSSSATLSNIACQPGRS